jgi:hypothetical protein
MILTRRRHPALRRAKLAAATQNHDILPSRHDRLAYQRRTSLVFRIRAVGETAFPPP